MDYKIKPVCIRFVVDFIIALPDGISKEEYEKYIEDFPMETDLEQGDISLQDYTPYEEYSQE